MLMTLTFPAGATVDNATQCLDINISDDAALEGSEILVVILTTPETYVMLGNDQTEVTISDNDGKAYWLSKYHLSFP